MPMSPPPKYAHDRRRSDDADDDLEAEALILHRFSTDQHGRSTVSSIPSSHSPTSTAARQPRVTDAYDDLDAEDLDKYGDPALERDAEFSGGRLGKLPPRGTLEGSNLSTQLDKTGRPAWFRGLLEGEVPALGLGGTGRHAGVSASAAQRGKRRRVRLFRIALLVAAGVVVVVLFSLALGPRLGLDVSKVYEYAGDRWYGDSGVMPFQFNKEIGWPGEYSEGKPAHLADEMRDPVFRSTPTMGASPIQTAIPGLPHDGENFKPFEHMGTFTPYTSSPGFGVDDARYGGTPRRSASGNGNGNGDGDDFCTLKQVHILHRHGARYPTTHAPPTEFAQFLKDHPAAQFSGSLAFLSRYEYRLGTELLTPVGRAQLYESGAKAALQYGALAAQDLQEKSNATHLAKKLFARAGSQQRIVDSGFAWLAGFWGEHWSNSTHFEIQIEADGYNTTTAPEYACPAWRRPGMFPGSAVADAYVARYLVGATARLQREVRGATLTPAVVYGMQSLCPFDTVAFGYSPFCALFTVDEWRDFEYSYDLKFQYSHGAPSPLGRALGLGWVNELVARLTATRWNATVQTSENATLNADARTFPLDRRMYVDFTHDSTVTAVLAALGLRELAEPIPKDRRDERRRFRTSWIVPFAARLVVEVWRCGPSETDGDETWLRLKLNDAVVPLAQLGRCESRNDGMCSLASFLASLEGRNEQGLWDICRSAA